MLQDVSHRHVEANQWVELIQRCLSALERIKGKTHHKNFMAREQYGDQKLLNFEKMILQYDAVKQIKDTLDSMDCLSKTKPDLVEQLRKLHFLEENELYKVSLSMEPPVNVSLTELGAKSLL